MPLVVWIILIIVGLIISSFIYTIKWRKNRNIFTFRGRLLSQINLVRERKYLKPLGRVKLLDNIAYSHSKSMAYRKLCDHQGFERRALIIKEQTGLTYVGENCYMFPARKYNSRVATELVRGWLKSPGHRANILSGQYKRTGIGITVRKGYVYATQLFTD